MRELLELAQVGGINIGMLVGIIGILGLVKKFDAGKYLAGGFYLLAVVVLGLVAGLVVTKGGIGDRIVGGISHAGVSSILYQYWNKLRPGKRVEKDGKFEIMRKE